MKARISYVALETNSGKIQKLEELYTIYRSYVQTCIDKMISDKSPKVLPSNRRTYFPTSDILSSQILKNAQMHSVQVVETWIKQRYAHKLRKYLNTQDLTSHQKLELRCIGKYQLKKPGKFGKGIISQEMIDLYWGWVWNPEIAGKTPQISESFPMWMSEMTCVFGSSEDSSHFGWWLRFSSLQNGVRIQIPLAYNPYLKKVEGLAKSVLVRKREGRWTFQFCEKDLEEENEEEKKPKEFDGSQGKIGIDVGLNVIAATSDGRLYGEAFKSEFDYLYAKVRNLRSNRFRQGLKSDSRRLARLEVKLSGQIKTITGTISNQLVKAYLNYTFVIEDLDLRGCRGQKRFAYRALHSSLSHKAKIEEVNPAYTSQPCPSCGHISRSNRSGVKFICQNCGRRSHADVIGAINLLGRSGDKQIDRCEDPSEVRALLRERSLLRRISSLDRLKTKELKPNSQRLTTKGSENSDVGTASNQVEAHVQV